MAIGTITEWDAEDGTGYIDPNEEGGTEDRIPLDREGLAEGASFEPREGMRVEYTVSGGMAGTFAKDVRPLGS